MKLTAVFSRPTSTATLPSHMARALNLSDGTEPRFTHGNVDFTGQVASQAASGLILALAISQTFSVMEWLPMACRMLRDGTCFQSWLLLLHLADKAHSFTQEGLDQPLAFAAVTDDDPRRIDPSRES